MAFRTTATVSPMRFGFTNSMLSRGELTRDRSSARMNRTGTPASRKGAWSLLAPSRDWTLLMGIPRSLPYLTASAARTVSPMTSREWPLPGTSMLIMATMDSISSPSSSWT